jgi:uncharacterized DUF497 family protein
VYSHRFAARASARSGELQFDVAVIVVLVAHTYRDAGGDEVIRIISARKATSPEKKAHEEGRQR